MIGLITGYFPIPDLHYTLLLLKFQLNSYLSPSVMDLHYTLLLLKSILLNLPTTFHTIYITKAGEYSKCCKY